MSAASRALADVARRIRVWRGGAGRSRARGPLWLRRLARALAVAYPVGLAAFALTLAYVGESWWASTVALYLPRVVLAVPMPVVVALLWAVGAVEWLWTQVASAALLLVPVMGLAVSLPRLQSPSAEGPRIRVMTYNINSAGGGVASLMREVDRYAPDVLVMVEIGGLEELTRELRQRYATLDVDGQFLTATRYPMTSKVDPDKLTFGGRNRSPRFLVETLETPLGKVTLYVVHPISPREDLGALAGTKGFRNLLRSGRLLEPGGPAVIQANTGLREAQIRAVADLATHEEGAVLIAGDTNLPGLSRVARQAFSSFNDGFLTAGNGFGYTYPTKHPWMRLDRIFANAELEFARFEVRFMPR